MKNIGIVGQGIIGSSWALVFARAGLHVRIWSREKEKATRSTIGATIAALTGTGLDGDADTLARISLHETLDEALQGADFIQESVPEDLALKHDVLSRIEAAAAADAIIASSTSGILPSRLIEAMARPERFLVVHPLSPPHLLPITELCTTPQTSPATLEVVTELLVAVGQRPVHLHKEIPGFALNRILGAMMNECFALVRDGILRPQDVDPLLTEGFGLRWGIIGPLAAMDLNAPGGIADYLRRYGGIYEIVARSRGGEPVLNPAFIDDLAQALQPVFANKDPALRRAQRDRGIGELRAARARILADADGDGTTSG
ncbi:3-hydroxyacyl-CoA dehydrogenase NAD-binding domain-containing protein [Labrys neptuniae]